ncbi:MAG TPA: hypothetical protein VM734_06855 [Kofleriaceae bacterium]|nr:hypothetical protein [Kofleriaceae bacterium]
MSLRISRASLASIATSARTPGRDCERSATPRSTTLARLGLGIALAATLAACGGGGKRGDTYVAATSAQEACCEHLTAGRDQCLAEIVRAPDEAVARSEANQDTYACVQEHFVCDPATGKASRESAQAQLDCIQDLPQ